VTADLEALILENGSNYVFMASWFNGSRHRTFDLSQYGFNQETMLQAFWLDLIKSNPEGYVYFHNFGGYDAILSLRALLSTAFNYHFRPIMKDGKFIAISVTLNGSRQLTILDSIRILPGSLSRLARDWKVNTMKSHFPHYFLLNNSIENTLNYKGSIPAYNFFESKRTSEAEYQEMLEEFSIKLFSLDVVP
jgi:hypothetical protein